MAERICPLCGGGFHTDGGCGYAFVLHGSRRYARVRYGEETEELPEARCSECGALAGRVHHVGCQVEMCPVCGGWLNDCGCAEGFAEDAG